MKFKLYSTQLELINVHFINLFRGPDQDVATVDRILQVSDNNSSRIIYNTSDILTITSGTPLELEEGYELSIKSVDINGYKAFIELFKNWNLIDYKIITISPAAYMLNKGDDLNSQDKYDEAIMAYDEAIRLDPKWAMPWNNKGNALFNLYKYDEAIITYDEAMRLDPEWATPWNNKGDALYAQENHDRAIQAYEEAIRLDPEWATPWNNKGEALYSQENYEGAIQAYEEAIRLDPEWATPWNNIAISLRKLGKYDEAIQAYEEAIRLDPEWATPWNNKGNVLEKQGKIDEAIKAYDEATKLDASKLKSEYPNTWYNRGQNFEARGLLPNAITCYDIAIEKDPSYNVAQNSKISALKKMGQYDEADDAYYEYRYANRADLIDYLSWLSCGFGVIWWYTIISGFIAVILFTGIYSVLSWRKGLCKTKLQALYSSLWFSFIVLLSAPKEMYPMKATIYEDYSEQIKYWPILERIIGWGLLILLINTLSRVMIRY